MRDSPALAVARELLTRGARVRAYDPAAAANAARELPDLELAETAEASLLGVDGVVIATEWHEFRELDWAAIRPGLRQPLIVDGRRLLDPVQMRALGYTYLVVGAADAKIPSIADEVPTAAV